MYINQRPVGDNLLTQNQTGLSSGSSLYSDSTGSNTAAGSKGGTAGQFAVGFSIMSAITGAYGAYRQAKDDIYKLDSHALSARYQQGMSLRNAEQAELMADVYMKQGHEQIAKRTLAAGREKSSQRTSAAARGVAVGSGSAGEIEDSIEAAKDADYLTINSNAVRAAGAAKMQAVMFKNKALMFGVEADNAKMMAGSINPSGRAFTSLLTGAANVSMAYNRYG